MSAPVTLGSLLAPIRDSPLEEELARIRLALADHRDRVYLVGGLVRDLLLGRQSRDIDLAVAGDLDSAANRLALMLGGEPKYHRPFMTARVESDRGFTIDLARLRREHYAESAALPRVEAGTLAQDLSRRDFTVNAMAVELGRETARVIDLHDGFADLADGLIRVLHEDSFRDDPTRILRGIRLAGEIGLAFEDSTRELAAAAPARLALRRVSGFRLWRELRYCFRTAAGAVYAIEDLGRLGLLSEIHPGLASAPELARDLERLEQDPERSWTAVEVLRVLSGGLVRQERWELAERLALGRRERLAIGVAPPGRNPAGPAR